MTKTEREAINEILLALNELPLPDDTSLDSIQISISANKFLSISKSTTLKKGWNFNTHVVELVPNEDKYIIIPNTFMSVDPVDKLSDVIVVDHRLYNKETNSYEFDGSIECEIIMEVDFDDIPFTFRDYIIKRAKVSAYVSIIGSTDELALYREELREAHVDAVREEADSIDGNVLSGQSFRN